MSARSWRPSRQAAGPYPATPDDIPALNQVFSDAFSERYRRDGLVGVRVPALNPVIWHYAIRDARGGALLWRDERDDIVAFNVAHRSGVEGWLGPLAVRPDWQDGGLGTRIVRTGMEWLAGQAARVIGLETMPRTMDNIGFYSNLGFTPGRLTLTLSLDAASGTRPPALLSRLAPADRDDATAECRALVQRLLPGYDFTQEIQLTAELALGDTVLLREGGALAGFAICHAVPLVEGRVREELRVLKLVAATDAQIAPLALLLADHARRCGTRRVALRAQTDYEAAYQALIGLGARVRWTDLRMWAADYPERRAPSGVVWSNWEI